MATSDRTRMAWWEWLLLPAALPVFAYHGLFHTNPPLHGVPAYLFNATRAFVQFMAICVVLLILSWIFPFSKGVSVSAGEVEEWVNHGCYAVDYCDRTSSSVNPMGKILVVFIQVFLKFPLFLASVLPGLQWPIELFARPTGKALSFMLRTGHLDHNFIWSMALGFWLVALIPLWLILWAGSWILKGLEWL